MRTHVPLGQHFLTSRRIARSIVDAADLKAGDVVLEIGPGKGMLTEVLLVKAERVVAIEKDGRCVEHLSEFFSDEIASGKLRLVHGDVLKADFALLGLRDRGFAAVANIPYYITGEIVERLLSRKPQPHTAILLVQREVAERIARSGKGSVLSMSVRAYGEPRYVKTVPARHFKPQPRVDSAILSIGHISKERFETLDEKRFFTVLKAGFAHKRKKLVGNLSAFASRERLLEIVTSIDINPGARPEDLSISEWFSLSRALRT